MRRRKQAQQLLLQWYEQMVLSFDLLTDQEKHELEAFEKKGPTSEWPGWERRIGKKPEAA